MVYGCKVQSGMTPITTTSNTRTRQKNSWEYEYGLIKLIYHIYIYVTLSCTGKTHSTMNIVKIATKYKLYLGS